MSRLRSRLDKRSISACAEASFAEVVQEDVHGVYLRVCGGIKLSLHLLTPLRGLSPRVRRHRPHRRTDLHTKGSISACAEASPTLRGRPLVVQVYLRVCGGIPPTKMLSSSS